MRLGSHGAERSWQKTGAKPSGMLTIFQHMVNHTTAIFRQINKDSPLTHHDALEFPDGQMVLLTDLFEGQEATVLQLPANPLPQLRPRPRSALHTSADSAGCMTV